MKKRFVPIIAISALLLVGGMSASLVSCDNGVVVQKKGTVAIEFDASKGEVKASISEGKVGDEVVLQVTPKAGFEVSTIVVNSKNLEAKDGQYKFSLVEGENKVVVTFKAKGTVETKYSVTANNGEGYEIKELSKTSAKEGEEITFKVNVTVENKTIDKVKFNTTEITPLDGLYKFKMPASNVSITVTLKNETPTPSEEYSIIATAGTGYEIVELSASKAIENTEITFKVNVTDTTKEIDVVKQNEVTLIAVNGVYSFLMPSSEVTIRVTLKNKTPTPTEGYSITATNGTGYEIVELSATKAVENTRITFKVNVTDATKEIESVKQNDQIVTDLNGVYSFTMPAKEVTITVTLKDKVIPQELVLKLNSNQTEYIEGASTARLSASFEELENIPAGTTFEWDIAGAREIGQVNEAGAEGNQFRYFVALRAGTGSITVKATLDGKEYTSKLDIIVKRIENYEAFTNIDSAAKLLELLNSSGAVNTNYYLSKNIDLGGATVNGRAKKLSFNGILDGRGYSITNFVVKNESDQEPDQATGLFFQVLGTIRNLHVSGTIDTLGFSGLLAKEIIGNRALIENCLFEAISPRSMEGGDWTWQRNGVIASCAQDNSVIRNCVTKLTSENAKTLPFVAYSFAPTQIIKDCYTNVEHTTGDSENYRPFNPQGGAVIDATNMNYTPFESTKASAYTTLDNAIWKLEDNKMPQLAHTGEEAVTLSPEVEASVDKTTLSLKDGGVKEATITSTLKYTSETATYSCDVTPNDSSIIEVTNNNDGTFKVKAVAAGSATVVVSATIKDKKYSSEAITFKVLGADAPQYEIPDDAFEIKDLATFKTVFDKGAAYSTKSFYLSADIDASSYVIDHEGLAGEFSGIFEGQGHTITTSVGWNLFNIIGSKGVVRNVDVVTEQPVEVSRGYFCYANNGTIENCNIQMSVNEGRATNTFAGVCFINNGTIKDTNVDFLINTSSNTIFSMCVQKGSGTVTNCTYTVGGTWDGAANAVIASEGSTKKED